MMKFRKKPVAIEAVQWFKMGDHPAVECDEYGTTGPVIKTLEGPLHVSPGDWIITGVKGEHYACKPDIFAATYEAADTPPQYVQGEPIAWLHRDHVTAYVITDRVKGIWLNVDPKHVENYTIPLYRRDISNACDSEK
jgi:hypothetical protein